MPKICIDCKHYSIGLQIPHLCTRPGLGLNLVTGEALNADAYKERNLTTYWGICGTEGKYWEPLFENDGTN